MHWSFAVCALAFTLVGCSTGGNRPLDRLAAMATIDATLDRLHDCAANADGTTYFGLFTSDAYFLGTDATERWTLPEFKAYAMPFFEQGKGWTYTPRDRHVHIESDGTIAWFDEIVTNAKYGDCRGTGVLRRVDDSDDPRRQLGGEWKIAQYSLTKLVPNDSMEAVVKAIGAPAKR
jgi:hypothetical protein